MTYITKKASEVIKAEDAINGLFNGVKMAESYGFTYSGAPSSISRAISNIANTLLLARSPSNSFLVNKYLLRYNQIMRSSKSSSLDDYFAAASQSFDSVAMNNALKIFTNLKPMLQFANAIKNSEIQSSPDNKASVNSLLSDAISQNSTDIYIDLIKKLEYYFKEIKEKSNVKYSALNEILLRKNIITGVNIVSNLENISEQEKSTILNIGQSISDLEYFIKTIQGNAKIRDVGSPINHELEIKHRTNYENVINEKSTKKESPQKGTSQFSYQITQVFSNDFKQETTASGEVLELLPSSGLSPILNIMYTGGISNNALEVFNSMVNSHLIKETNDSQGILRKIQSQNETNISVAEDSDGNNILTISFNKSLLNNYKGKPILIFLINNKNLTAFASKKYIVNTDIKKISFTAEDLIKESSNISDLEKKLILKKIKKWIRNHIQHQHLRSLYRLNRQRYQHLQPKTTLDLEALYFQGCIRTRQC